MSLDRRNAVRAILCICSGVGARIYGSPRYDDIDAGEAALVAWIYAQPDNKRWETWHDVVADWLASKKLPAGA